MDSTALRILLVIFTAVFISAGCTTARPVHELPVDQHTKLEEHCTAARAYADGEAGRGYRNICPADLRDEYETAYDIGRRVYDVNRRLQVIGETITDKQHHIWRLQRDIAALKRAQERSDLPPTELAGLKAETARLERERAGLTGDLDRLRARRAAESDMLTSLETGDFGL